MKRHNPRLDNSAAGWQLPFVASDKLERLKDLLRSYGSCLVAYSGGVDSVLLARVAFEVLGDRMLAVIADSPSLPRRELEEARSISTRFHFPLRVIKTGEFNNPDYLVNPANRCYFCKHELFAELSPIALNEGFAIVAYGENASDVGDFRPGSNAAREFEVRAPLKEAGLTKTEIRELSGALGLPTADKPQLACLSSRIPHGERVTPGKLRMIEEAEYCLRDLGFYEVRVRHHELTDEISDGPLRGGLQHLARIEVGASEVARLRSEGLMATVAKEFHQIGYAQVELDERGYRRGSLNDPRRLKPVP